ncbi:hypothetical protein MRB53_042002 [Persea americana]|nr:hypothetical protein MRB53_042002 [Persea americana]
MISQPTNKPRTPTCPQPPILLHSSSSSLPRAPANSDTDTDTGIETPRSPSLLPPSIHPQRPSPLAAISLILRKPSRRRIGKARVWEGLFWYTVRGGGEVEWGIIKRASRGMGSMNGVVYVYVCVHVLVVTVGARGSRVLTVWKEEVERQTLHSRCERSDTIELTERSATDGRIDGAIGRCVGVRRRETANEIEEWKKAITQRELGSADPTTPRAGLHATRVDGDDVSTVG